MRFERLATGVFVFFLGVGPLPAAAGPFTDEASKCLVTSTTRQERTELMKWFFYSVANHPDLALDSPPAESDVALANKKVADLFTDLVSTRCLEPLKNARTYENGNVFQQSFGVLGEVASMELASNPDVLKKLSKFSELLDKERIKAALGVK